MKTQKPLRTQRFWIIYGSGSTSRDMSRRPETRWPHTCSVWRVGRLRDKAAQRGPERFRCTHVTFGDPTRSAMDGPRRTRIVSPAHGRRGNHCVCNVWRPMSFKEELVVGNILQTCARTVANWNRGSRTRRVGRAGEHKSSGIPCMRTAIHESKKSSI